MSVLTLFGSDVNPCVTVPNVPACDPAMQNASYEIAFIDSRLNDLPTLVAGLRTDIQTYILHPEEDCIEQIDAVLKLTGTVHALYLIGHGAPGIMHLGRGELSTATLATHAAIVARWQVQEILLYGCQVGQNQKLL